MKNNAVNSFRKIAQVISTFLPRPCILPWPFYCPGLARGMPSFASVDTMLPVAPFRIDATVRSLAAVVMGSLNRWFVTFDQVLTLQIISFKTAREETVDTTSMIYPLIEGKLKNSTKSWPPPLPGGPRVRRILVKHSSGPWRHTSPRYQADMWWGRCRKVEELQDLRP